MSRLATAIDSLSPAVQAGANWTSFGTAVSASIAIIVGAVQGPLAVLASLLSAAWLGLQIYTWFEKRRRPEGRRRRGDW